MERYAPTLKDLAPRDFVSAAWTRRSRKVAAAGPTRTTSARHDAPGRRHHHEALPSVFEIGHNFANVDITKEPIPVVPTIHYQMGGIPTNIHGQVVAPKDGNPNAVVNGLYAVGECSCVSVHGANRLGTNSLLDLLVFGRAAGNHIVEFNKLKNQATSRCRPMPPTARWRAWRGWTAAPAASTPRTWPTTSAHDAGARRRVPHPGLPDEGVGKIAASPSACAHRR
jgi:succinate dehydrogenase / fumarate reductase flavoprotein subunit